MREYFIYFPPSLFISYTKFKTLPEISMRQCEYLKREKIFFILSLRKWFLGSSVGRAGGC